MKPIFMDNTGPLIIYSDGNLVIEDLNPEVKIKWAMSRKEMLKVGWRFILSALKG
jgi:hypothetical protein